MKKLLSLIGIVAITGSASSTAASIVKTNADIQTGQSHNQLDFHHVAKNLSVTRQDLNVDWISFNQFIALDFGDSNEYAPTTSTYDPENWWEVWDWGWRIDFPEGDINVMRVVKLVYSLYNGLNFRPLEDLLKSTNNLFKYLLALDQHDQDLIAVLHDIIVKTEKDLKDSGVPITDEVFNVLNQFSSILKPFRNFKLITFSSIIKRQVESELGMSIDEIGIKYFAIINQSIKALGIVNSVLEVIQDSIPAIVWQFIVDNLGTIANQMAAADQNHNGVYLKFQQFVVPMGFKAR
ncbi:MAG: hypothetical protein REH79_00315 [Spiroplasma sp.]|nr:hypothetical protein [Spiroplasma sp.]